MQKDDSVPSAVTNADSEQKDHDIFQNSNDTKPSVVGLPSLSDEKVVKVEVSDNLVCLSYNLNDVPQKPIFLSHANLISACLASIRQAIFQNFSGSQSDSHKSYKICQ